MGNLREEHEMVFLLTQFREPNRERIKQLASQMLDWAEILGHLVYNRTAGVAYTVIQQCMPLPLNHEIEFLLYMIHEMQKLRTKNHRQFILDVSNKLRMQKIPHAFLKGSVLATTTYPEGGRVSKDIDLLVRAHDLTACGKAFQELGYIQGSYDLATNSIKPASRREIMMHRLNYGEVFPYQKLVKLHGVNVSVVDLNFSLDWVATGTDNAVASFLNESQEYELGSGEVVNSLSREHFLAHLCSHLYKEAVVLNWVEWQRDLLLYKFLDIYAFITVPNQKFQWNRFAEIVNEHNLQKEAYYALHYTSQFYPQVIKTNGWTEGISSIQPSDTEYLHQVLDPANPGRILEWKENILIRFFDMKRFDRLVQVELTS